MASKLTPEWKARVRGFLDIGWSYSVIIKHLKSKNISISQSTISRLKNSDENSPKIDRRRGNSGRNSVLTESQNIRIKNWAKRENPPPIRTMATQLGTNRGVVSYQINKVLRKKIHRKPKCHALNSKTIEKRYRRSWPLSPVKTRSLARSDHHR